MTRNGLQQWRPVLKVAFPIDGEAVRAVWEALRLPAPVLARETYTAEQLEAELTGPGTGVRAVAVHKHRVRYVIDGCTSELTDVVADGRTTRTIAVETEDPALVTAAVRTLGLADYRNTAYPPGLAALLDGVPPRYAVIDAGTNSIKFHVAERDGAGFRTLVDRAELTRLGEGLEAGGVVTPDALARTRDAIAGMVREADELHAVAIVAVGTAGLRIATNGDAVVEAVAEATGVRIEVISGEDEARLAYLAVLAGLGLPDASLAVFDTGGGSTQLTFGTGTEVTERFSVDVGAVRFTEQFGLDGPVSTEVLAEALAAIRADLSRLDGRDPVDRAGRDGRRGHQHRRRVPRHDDLRPGRHPGQRPRALGARPPDRAVPDAPRRRAACDPGTPAQARGRDPRRSVRRRIGDGRARRRPADGERPWPPARRPGNAVRRHPDRIGGIEMSPTKAKTAAATAPPATTGGSSRLSDAQLGEVLKLIRGADSVELKATVPVDQHRATIQGLPLDPVEAQPRQVYFFDTPDLTLNKAGLVVRARRTQGGRGDTVIKLRPVEPGGPARVPPAPGRLQRRGRRPARRLRVLGVAQGPLDRRRGPRGGDRRQPRCAACSRSRSASSTGRTRPRASRSTISSRSGRRSCSSPASTSSSALTKRSIQSLVAEMWFYPDGSRILELSTKCLPEDALKVAGETRAYLVERGINLDGEQQTKTKTALEFYAGGSAPSGS